MSKYIFALMELSYTIENYLKAIYKLSDSNMAAVTTNQIAAAQNTKPSTANDMIKKLADKKYISYQKYRGVTMTAKGNKQALEIIRKHRLWEVFLVKTLGFKWDEVHHIAEQMEHVSSDELINRLDKFLEYPKYDPHGDPIPDAKGKIEKPQLIQLSQLNKGDTGIVSGVMDHSDKFLQHLEKVALNIGTKIKVTDKSEYDNSFQILLPKAKSLHISNAVAINLLIRKA